MSQSKRPPPPEAVSPRVTTETVGRGLRERIHPPEKPFHEDIVEEVHQVLRTHVEGPCELGVYNEAEDRSSPARLGGRPRTIAFDEIWRQFFEKLTPDRRENILFLADELDDKSAREAFKSIIAAEIKRKALSDFKKGLKNTAVVCVMTGALVLAWFTDQVSNFMSKWPAVKSAWGIFFGARN